VWVITTKPRIFAGETLSGGAVKKKKEELKLDLGCGKNKRQDGKWTGVDIRKFEGVDVVADLRKRWPWANNSVTEVHASHFVEHLDADERIHFCNELYRVLIPKGKATVVTPHWASTRAYGDMTHKWPPVSEFWFYYLSKEWRAVNAPHNDGYICDFEVTWGYALRQDVISRNQEWQQFAIANYKEVVSDMIATMVKK
jgi:hypothetical protein